MNNPEIYLNDLDADARDNPLFTKGTFVEVMGCYIGDTGNRESYGFGVVIGREWDDKYYNYSYEVKMFDDGALFIAWQQDLMRIYFTGSYRKSVFNQLRRSGMGK